MQLRQAAQDRFLTKYAYSMRGVRWEAIVKHVKLAKNYISEDRLRFIFTEFFEPTTMKKTMWELPQVYFDFLLEDEDARKALIESAPSFIFDVLTFERAQVRVWAKLRDNSRPPEGSLLVHRAYEIVDLDHDILDLLNRLTGEETFGNAPVPVARQVKILILPQAQTKNCRFFEVNDELQAFLDGQLTGARSENRPEFYADLVSIGLCL